MEHKASYLLPCCAALAAGEYAASFAANCADAWPVAAFVSALVALFGFGLSWRFWPVAAVAALGVTLFLFASVSDERDFRVRPWLRNRPARSSGGFGGSAVLRGVRGDVSRRIGIGLARGDEAVSLGRAILLGERRRLSAGTKRLFVESGTMHVFAISGLHVMAIAKMLACALMLLLVPRRLCGLLAVPLLWGYVALIGFAPSAVRAALMATLDCLASVFWRRHNGLRAWGLAFLAVHFANPKMIVDVGNVLSFAVMLAIVLAGEGVRDLPGWCGGLFVTFAAWAVGVPISAHVFGRVTPGGLLANLVLLGAARVTVVASAAGVFASYVSQTVAAHLNNLGALSIRAMVLVAEGVSRLPGANFETGRWPLAACALWYAGLAAAAIVLLRVRERRRAI